MNPRAIEIDLPSSEADKDVFVSSSDQYEETFETDTTDPSQKMQADSTGAPTLAERFYHGVDNAGGGGKFIKNKGTTGEDIPLISNPQHEMLEEMRIKTDANSSTDYVDPVSEFMTPIEQSPTSDDAFEIEHEPLKSECDPGDVRLSKEFVRKIIKEAVVNKLTDLRKSGIDRPTVKLVETRLVKTLSLLPPAILMEIKQSVEKELNKHLKCEFNNALSGK
jgi:hypothetical protein